MQSYSNSHHQPSILDSMRKSLAMESKFRPAIQPGCSIHLVLSRLARKSSSFVSTFQSRPPLFYLHLASRILNSRQQKQIERPGLTWDRFLLENVYTRKCISVCQQISTMYEFFENFRIYNVEFSILIRIEWKKNGSDYYSDNYFVSEIDEMKFEINGGVSKYFRRITRLV